MKLLRALGRGIAAPFGFLHTALCALMTDPGLKAWALLMSWGCSVAMTAFATYALWLDRNKPGYVFWLGTEAMCLILVIITGIMYLLGVQRNITAKKGDSEFSMTDATSRAPTATTKTTTETIISPPADAAGDATQ